MTDAPRPCAGPLALSRRSLLIGLGGAVLSSCTNAPPAVTPSEVSVGQPVSYDARGLAIRGRYHPPQTGHPPRRIWVVIEGDGAAWHRGQPPTDPTPRRPVGPAVLEALPKDDARLWLARPCQFLPPGALATCAPRYWTDGRFSGPVIAAYQALITQHAKGLPVILTGFSGGGVLTAELALTRRDAAGLITLAAPLDLEAWTRHHGVPPLAGPRPSAKMLRDLATLRIPTLYLFGARDTVVPPAMLPRTLATLPTDRVRIVPGMRHSGDWATLVGRNATALLPQPSAL
ncbi:hypothetical protein OO012_15130 [Rhodobacteraceae bacterium KMM 6894]|nr:hypothetical protein [Rhodobacteraceae bacterium KMM 6894]